MAERRCDCCDMPVWMCGKATEDRQLQARRALRERALAEPGVVPARHRIHDCPGCGEPVPVGDPIQKTADGWIGVLCCGRLDA